MGAYWPDGITEPQHLWPFFQTGDYSDQGSTGGLTLTAVNSPGFDENGLICSAGNFARYTGTNADINNLGDTFSIIFEGFWSPGDSYQSAINLGTSGSYPNQPYYLFFYPTDSIIVTRMGDGATFNDASVNALPSSGVSFQYIYTQSGTTGKIYINGTQSGSSFTGLLTPDTTQSNLSIGSGAISSYVGTIKRVGILKGTAWSADDVADIYAWSPGAADVNATATESSTVLESIAASITAAVLLTVGVSDAATVTEAINTAVAEQPTLTIDLADQTGILESIAAATSLAETLGVDIQEAIAAYEAANTTVAEQVILSASSVDIVGVSEEVAGIVPSITARDVSTADTATATTTAAVNVTQLPRSVTAADSVTINEQTTAIVTLEEYATVTDEIGVIDLANVNVAFIGSLIEVPIYQAESEMYRYVGMVRLP